VHPAILLGHPANSEWTKLPFSDPLLWKNLLPEKIPEDVFPENFRKKVLSEEEGGLPKELPEDVFRKFFLEVGSSGRPPSSSGRRFFRK